MSHRHPIIDDDVRFRVNEDTKAIIDSEPSKRTIVQYDHKSERYTFEIARIIEGHDMSQCNKVEVHFTNVDKTTKEQTDGFDTLTDLHVSTEDDTKVICSWLIERKSTQRIGPLYFSIRYACENPDGSIEYEYNTRKYTRISVAEGMGNRDAINILQEQINEYIEHNGYEQIPATYILVDEDGNEVPAVLVDEPVELTATPNDIRLGTTAVTAEGVVTGEKEIPAYHTDEGYRIVTPGDALEIPMYSDRCQYTKLQVVICEFNSTMSDSTSAEMVVLLDKLYAVRSNVALANVTVDTDNQTIKLGIANDSDKTLILRYMTIKEEV